MKMEKKLNQVRGIRKRTNGKYQGYIAHTTPRGMKHNITVPGTFNTEQEAIVERAKFITNLI